MCATRHMPYHFVFERACAETLDMCGRLNASVSVCIRCAFDGFH